MVKKILVESFSALEKAIERFGSDKVQYLTSSPYLLKKKYQKNIEIQSIEENIRIKDMNIIGNASYEFAEEISQILNSRCEWKKYIDFKLVYGVQVVKLFNCLVYKSFLLNQILQNCSEKDTIVCVGDPSISKVKNLSIEVGRFDNIFSFILEENNKTNIIQMYFKEDFNKLYNIENLINNRKMSFVEKLLSIFTNTFSSFCFKIFNKLANKKIIKSLTFNFFYKKKIYIYKNCEILEESFLSFLFNGYKILKLNQLPKINDCNKFVYNKYGLISDEIKNTYSNIIKKHNIKSFYFDDRVSEIISNRIVQSISQLYKNFAILNNDFKSLTNSISDNDEIHTNWFANPIERIFGQYCLYNNIKIVAYEHGITLGMSKWAELSMMYWGSLIANKSIYFWKKSLLHIEKVAKNNKSIIFGIPKIITNEKFVFFKKIIIKKWLNIKLNEHVVIISLLLEKNNLIVLPYAENDHNYLNTSLDMIHDVKKKFPLSKIILKIYPTSRYPETYSFSDIVTDDKIIILKYIDLRFIRCVADVIATTSNQSTLSWIVASNSKTLHYETYSNPSIFESKKIIKQENLPNSKFIKNISYFDKKFLID